MLNQYVVEGRIYSLTLIFICLWSCSALESGSKWTQTFLYGRRFEYSKRCTVSSLDFPDHHRIQQIGNSVVFTYKLHDHGQALSQFQNGHSLRSSSASPLSTLLHTQGTPMTVLSVCVWYDTACYLFSTISLSWLVANWLSIFRLTETWNHSTRALLGYQYSLRIT